jgi:hypothetical protein
VPWWLFIQVLYQCSAPCSVRITEGFGCREAPLRWYGIVGALHRNSLLEAALHNKHNNRSRTTSKHHAFDLKQRLVFSWQLPVASLQLPVASLQFSVSSF